MMSSRRGSVRCRTDAVALHVVQAAQACVGVRRRAAEVSVAVGCTMRRCEMSRRCSARLQPCTLQLAQQRIDGGPQASHHASVLRPRRQRMHFEALRLPPQALSPFPELADLADEARPLLARVRCSGRHAPHHQLRLPEGAAQLRNLGCGGPPVRQALPQGPVFNPQRLHTRGAVAGGVARVHRDGEAVEDVPHVPGILALADLQGRGGRGRDLQQRQGQRGRRWCSSGAGSSWRNSGAVVCRRSITCRNKRSRACQRGHCCTPHASSRRWGRIERGRCAQVVGGRGASTRRLCISSSSSTSRRQERLGECY